MGMKEVMNKINKQLIITFDDHNIRFLEVSIKERKIVKFDHFFSVENTIIEEGGIVDKAKWRKLLRGTLKENKITAKSVYLVVPTSYILLRHLSMPNVSKKEIKQIIQFELGKTLHVPFDSPIIDVYKMEFQGDQTQANTIMVAAPGSMIYPLVSGLRSNRLKPKGVNIPVLSLYSLFEIMYPNEKDQPIVLSYITKEGIDLHIIDQGIVWLSRHIPMSINFENEEENKRDLLNYDLANEMDRAINFYQYSLSQSKKKPIGCWIASEIEFPKDFYQKLEEYLDLQVAPLKYYQDNENLYTTKLLGYETALGTLYEEGKIL